MAAKRPTAWSEADVVAETLAFYEYAEARLARCERCPEGGGECAGEDSNFAAGQQPMWDADHERLGERRCDRWREYLVRRRVLAAGVPASAVAHRMSGYDGAGAAELGELFAAIVERRSGRHWLLLSGPQGSGKTHLAASLIRNVCVSASDRSVVYLNALQAQPRIKEYWTLPAEVPDPLRPLRLAAVAVIENIDSKRLSSPAIANAFSLALAARWEAELPTLVTTHESRSQLAKMLCDITNFAGATECKLNR